MCLTSHRHTQVLAPWASILSVLPHKAALGESAINLTSQGGAQGTEAEQSEAIQLLKPQAYTFCEEQLASAVSCTSSVSGFSRREGCLFRTHIL